MRSKINSRLDRFEKDYGKDIKRLSTSKYGKTLTIPIQVYKLNGLIYKELDTCRHEGIDPKTSECHYMLLEEGKKRFEKHGYIYGGRIFVRKDKI